MDFQTELVFLQSAVTTDGTWPTLPLAAGDEVVFAEPGGAGKHRWLSAIVQRKIPETS